MIHQQILSSEMWISETPPFPGVMANIMAAFLIHIDLSWFVSTHDIQETITGHTGCSFTSCGQLQKSSGE